MVDNVVSDRLAQFFEENPGPARQILERLVREANEMLDNQ